MAIEEKESETNDTAVVPCPSTGPEVPAAAAEVRCEGRGNENGKKLGRPNQKAVSRASVSPDFICPLTGNIMVDPVVAPDGVSYERAALVEWLHSSGGFLPRSRVRAHRGQLVGNHSLKQQIGQYLASDEGNRRGAVSVKAGGGTQTGRGSKSTARDADAIAGFTRFLLERESRSPTSAARNNMPGKSSIGRAGKSSIRKDRESCCLAATASASARNNMPGKSSIGRECSAARDNMPGKSSIRRSYPSSAPPVSKEKTSVAKPEAPITQPYSRARLSMSSGKDCKSCRLAATASASAYSNARRDDAAIKARAKQMTVPETLPPLRPPVTDFGCSAEAATFRPESRRQHHPHFSRNQAEANTSRMETAQSSQPAQSHHEPDVAQPSQPPQSRHEPDGAEPPELMVSAVLVSPENDVENCSEEEPKLIVMAQPLKKNRWVRAALAMLVLTLVGIILGLTLRDKKQGSPSNKYNFTDPSPTQVLHILNESVFEETKTSVCARLPISCPSLSNETSAQHKALAWLASDPNVSSYSMVRRLQRYALASLFHSTRGWEVFRSSWLSYPKHECEWYKVNCSQSLISEIMLDDLLTGGLLPRELALLNQSLKSLNLGNNQLSGSIPSEFGLLHNLRSLFLPSNNLQGTVPREIGGLNSLELLSVRFNQLTGSIPSEVCSLRDANLKDIWADCISEIECDCCTECCDETECCAGARCRDSTMVADGFDVGGKRKNRTKFGET